MDTVRPVLQRLAQQPRKVVLAGLGAAVAVLVVLNLYLMWRPVDVSPLATSRSERIGAAQPGANALRTPLDDKPAGSFAQTVTRPIFYADRKPVERQQPQNPPVAGPEDWRLMGILETPRSKRALIRPGGEAKGVWLVEGEDVAGWTLKSIGARSVVVVSGARSYEIPLNKAAGR